MKSFSGLAALALAGLVVAAGQGSAAETQRTAISKPSTVPPGAVFLGAQPMEMPTLQGLTLKRQPAGAADGRTRAAKETPVPAGIRPQAGGPALTPIQLVPEGGSGRGGTRATGAARPKAMGPAGVAFSTSRVDVGGRSTSLASHYPYRAVGRLAFRIGTANAWCSAALIGPGLVLTAAHCVAQYGEGYFENGEWAFIPGYHLGKGAYGVYRYMEVFAPESYLDGSEDCLSEGVGCLNDVAVIVLRPNARKRYPGAQTGWLGVQWDRWGFAMDDTTQVTQLGYPRGIDGGRQMIRNDSAGAVFVDFPDHVAIGSPLNEGSSGGPWVANFGTPPQYDEDTTPPEFADPNTIVGLTSWGMVGEFLVGSSQLTADNAGALIESACTKYPAACAPR